MRKELAHQRTSKDCKVHEDCKGLQRTANEIHQHGRGFIVFVHNLRLLRPHKIWQKFCFQFVRGRLLMVPREIKKTT